MPGQIRPDEKLVKVVNEIIKKPKDKQQKNEKEPSAERLDRWIVDSSSLVPK